jgi:predicted enzyme related to lactoylglutathione lyase
MGERTSYEPGTFSYAELATSDAAGAKEFYSGLFGWEPEDAPVGTDMVYTMLRLGGKTVGALYEAEQAPHPAWLSYVTVEDADATAAKATELGANVMTEPFDVMTFGRMAVLQDPTGAVFAIWQANESIGAELVNVPGSMTMNQINTTDVEAAQSFYSELFGWRAERLTELGDADGVQYWGILNDDRLNGGMMELVEPAREAGVPSHWLVFFTVEDADAAVSRIRELGGQVQVEPTEIPAGRFAIAFDPQGATFALFEGDVDD